MMMHSVGICSLLQLAQQREPVELRHLEVGEHDAVALLGQPLERLLSVGRDLDVVALVGQDRAQAGGDRLLVVGDENFRIGLLHSSRGASPSAGKADGNGGRFRLELDAGFRAPRHDLVGQRSRAVATLDPNRRRRAPSPTARQRRSLDRVDRGQQALARSPTRTALPRRRRHAQARRARRRFAASRPSARAAGASNATMRRTIGAISIGSRAGARQAAAPPSSRSRVELIRRRVANVRDAAAGASGFSRPRPHDLEVHRHAVQRTLQLVRRTSPQMRCSVSSQSASTSPRRRSSSVAQVRVVRRGGNRDRLVGSGRWIAAAFTNFATIGAVLPIASWSNRNVELLVVRAWRAPPSRRPADPRAAP